FRAYAMARRTCTSWNGSAFWLKDRKSVRLEGNSLTTTPDALFRLSRADHGGNSSMWACPPFTWRIRVLSSGTLFQEIASRYGLPCCQYDGFRFSRTSSPLVH